MELFESKLDAIIKAKSAEANALLEVKAEEKQQRAEEKKLAIESGTLIEKPKRGRKAKESN
jgi:hypothetical protein